ncbi:DgyrCDS4771 [Dimorphilus gyrociliatus]|uniref:DgyrCDS4771 n=1 Tax=Dimorphilus gyrociliatus TaxID=2664684 RepID=A0A7I8VHZ8_9ANNE|nr:DgyrCDS4771 [Dimorphilus gyrociliatus]
MSKYKKKHEDRPRRATSNIFAMLSERQRNDLMDAFKLIDHHKDDVIDELDLEFMLKSIGKSDAKEVAAEMMKEVPGGGPINRIVFLTLFGERLKDVDPEEVILNAFQCLDEDNTGEISTERLHQLMTTQGDRWKNENVEELFSKAPIQSQQFQYKKFVQELKYGKKESDDET